jgi:hypothetical protein
MKSHILALIAFVAVLSLPARAAYSAATVHGSYSFLLNEWTATSGTNSATLGILDFDGTAVVSGSFLQVTDTGEQEYNIESGSSYSVEGNGVGSMTLITSSGTLPFSFVLGSVSGSVAEQLQLLLLNPTGMNAVTAGTAVAINLTGPPSNANLKGTYSLLINDWQANPSWPMIGAVGVFRFDGVSKAVVSYTQEVGGVSSTQALVGTYAVQGTGSGQMFFGSGEDAVTYNFAFNNVRKSVATGLQFMFGGNDVVSTGTAVLR